MRDVELLIPASNLEVLKVAVLYGADAVYIGGEMYGLRAKAKNFSMEDVKEGIEFAHKHGVKVYITANIVAHNEDLEGIRKYFEELKEIKPDALIISDPGVFMIAKEVCPDIDRHISTQANSTNYATYKFWYDQGASRVVSARELSLEEIKDIRAHIPDDMEIESFIHGAMCISHSGRCLLSNYFTGRNANSGECTHPCRWKYSVMEQTRPGEYMPVYENEEAKKLFFYISDDSYFPANYTAMDLVRFYRNFYPQFRTRFFHELMEQFHLEENRRIATFSKGMKKQVLVIIGVCAATKYLFCDETFDGLDPVMRQAVKSLFAAEIMNREFTPVIASHNLRELEDICYHVGLLHKGGILLSKDLEDMKFHIHKIQCVLSGRQQEKELEKELQVLKVQHQGSLLMITARGTRSEIIEKIQAKNPLFMEVLPLTLEEIFISETEVAGYEIKNLF